MIEIDGSFGEGGGQILRTALSLSCVLQQPIRIFNIRKQRAKPGLMPQHLTCVHALKEICTAEVEGNVQGSHELTFRPKATKPGVYNFDIGTAGSTTLLLQAILPPLLFAGKGSRIIMKGGTHVPFSPPFHYLLEVFIPLLGRMGITVVAAIERYGFYPRGGGQITIETLPVDSINGLTLLKRGPVRIVRGTSVVANLPISIAERQKKAAMSSIASHQLNSEVTTISVQSPGAGTFISLVVEGNDCFAGFSSLGKRGKRSETVGTEAAEDFFQYLSTMACLDPHIADQILLYLAFAGSDSSFTTSRITRHLMTNCWVIEQFRALQYSIEGKEGMSGKVSLSGTGRSV